jgi:glycerol uptake facilitator-like aquaporin
LCELLGTATLILVCCGAISVGGFGSEFPVGILPVALAFGLSVMAVLKLMEKYAHVPMSFR